MELNSDGKIQVEESVNDSIINGDSNSVADTTAIVSDSTLDDSCKNGTSDLDKTDASDNQTTPTAAVLSIDDPENGEIFQNHLICNNINNNHIPNKPDTEPASNDATNTSDNNTNDKRNDANGDVVNIDSDNKRLFNNANTDAANAVGFQKEKEKSSIFLFLSQLIAIVIFFFFFWFCSHARYSIVFCTI